jgi:hypothetical protein
MECLAPFDHKIHSLFARKVADMVGTYEREGDPYYQRTDQHPVEVETRPRSWIFRFYGAEGADVLKHWMEAVRTDATYRIILGLE